MKGAGDTSEHWESWILDPFFFKPETPLNNSLLIYKADQAETSIGNDSMVEAPPPF